LALGDHTCGLVRLVGAAEIRIARFQTGWTGGNRDPVFEADDQQSFAAVEKRTSHRCGPPTSVPHPHRRGGLDVFGPGGRPARLGVSVTRFHFRTELNRIV
jgi:hypothetical protein